MAAMSSSDGGWSRNSPAHAPSMAWLQWKRSRKRSAARSESSCLSIIVVVLGCFVLITGYLEKLPFRPISASQENKKCSHMINMLRFLISLFLDLERKC
jgi:hypothetical protein